MEPKYVPPTHHKNGFSCPYCDAFAEQTWFDSAYGHKDQGDLRGRLYSFIDRLEVSLCSRCAHFAIWREGIMIYPRASSVPMPSEDMPGDVQADYSEARSISNDSPRSACALLRLAVQKLMLALGEEGNNLNEDIRNLVKKGLPITVQRALDSVRVIGNEAVHPGTLDLKDDIPTATAMFGLVNLVVNVMITQPKEVDEIYAKLPELKKNEISKRDGK